MIQMRLNVQPSGEHMCERWLGALCWIFCAQAAMPNKRLAQSKLVRMVLNKGEALA
jgi:hypothetical protein